MEDLELLDEAGEAPPVDRLRNMVERTVNPWPG